MEFGMNRKQTLHHTKALGEMTQKELSVLLEASAMQGLAGPLRIDSSVGSKCILPPPHTLSRPEIRFHSESSKALRGLSYWLENMPLIGPDLALQPREGVERRS